MSEATADETGQAVVVWGQPVPTNDSSSRALYLVVIAAGPEKTDMGRDRPTDRRVYLPVTDADDSYRTTTFPDL